MKNILIALLFISGSAAAQRTGFYPVRAAQSFGKIELRDSTILTALTASKIMKLDANKNITTATDGTDYWSPSTMALASGTYTPTLTNLANIDASTAFRCHYLRVGNEITVSGYVEIDPTAAASQCQMTMTLPVASDLVNAQDLGGTIATYSSTKEVGSCFASTVSNTAAILFYANGTANTQFTFVFSYVIQ